MPPLNKKGFYATTPLVGTLLFVIAAAIVILFSGESTMQVDIATSSDAHSRMIFIGEAILADSFTNLMQKEVEKIVVEFISGEEPVEIDPRKSWETNLQDALVNQIKEDMEYDMESILEAYTEAYTGLPGQVRCRTDNAEGSKTLPSFGEIDDGDGTIWVRAFTFGKNINCTSQDPPSTTIVNFWDREYIVNVRIINLFRAAVSVLDMAIDAIDNPYMAEATQGGTYIRAEMETAKWKRVEEGNNKIVAEDADNEMTALLNDWTDKNEFLKQRLSSIVPSKQSIYSDFELVSFSANFEDGVDGFTVHCAESDTEKTISCASAYYSLTLGNKACSSDSWQSYYPLHNQDPFLRLSDFSARYYIDDDSGTTQIEHTRDMDLIMRELFSLLGYACVNMDETIKYGGYGVCKEWVAVPSNIEFNGSIMDTNSNFNPTISDSVSFNFVSTYSPYGYIGEGLECQDVDTATSQMNIYLNDFLSLLELKFAYVAQVGQWKDLGSSLMESKATTDQNWILDMFRDTAEGAELPLVEFNGNAPSYIKPAQSDYGSERVIKVSVDWSSFVEKCSSTVFTNALCREVCGSNPKTVATNAANFCGSLAESGHAVSSSMLECHCSDGDKYLSMSVESLALSG